MICKQHKLSVFLPPRLCPSVPHRYADTQVRASGVCDVGHPSVTVCVATLESLMATLCKNPLPVSSPAARHVPVSCFSGPVRSGSFRPLKKHCADELLAWTTEKRFSAISLRSATHLHVRAQTPPPRVPSACDS